MSDDKPTKPRMHRWRRPPEGSKPAAAPEPGTLSVRVPAGPPPDPERLADAISASLRGWPVVVLKLLGKAEDRVKLGRNPGRWLRGELDLFADRGMSPSEREQTFGRAPKGPGGGDPWAPIALRASSLPDGRAEPGDLLRAELVLAGRAVDIAPRIVGLLQADRRPEGAAPVAWTGVQYMAFEEGETRWRKWRSPDREEVLLPLDRLTEPRLRRRLTVAFLSETAVTRREEEAKFAPDWTLFVERATRSMITWMHRTGHRGPKLPFDALLRAAEGVTLAADNSRIVELPAQLVGGIGEARTRGGPPPGHRGRPPKPERDTPPTVQALLGQITWRGDFRALAPLLRAVHTVGMGPGRARGFGEVGLR